MCGLVGLYARHHANDNHMKLLSQLLWIDQLRGEHATGMAKVDLAKNEVAIHKAAVNATDYLSKEETKEFFSKNRGRLWIGHNRFATMGSRDDDNCAHPFQHKHITLVHNGTVDRWALTDLEGFVECKVDSEMVCRTIAELGPHEAVTKKLSGAFALVWYDSDERSLNFIRNKDRPLYLATLSDNTLVWASDRKYLDFFIADNPKQSLSFHKEGEPTLLPTDILFTWKFNDKGALEDTKPVAKPMKFCNKVNPNPPRVTHRGSNSLYGGYGWDGYKEDPRDIYEGNNYSSPIGKAVSTTTAASMEARINELLDKNKLNCKAGDEITFDFVKWVEYNDKTSKGRGTLTGTFGTQNFEVQAYNVEWSKIEGSLRLRGEISNAYTRIQGQSSRLVITVTGPVRALKEKKPDAVAEVGGAGAAAEDKEPAFVSNWVPGTWPLKVDGITFNNRFEFEQVAAGGCVLCSKTPSFRNILNPKISVYPPTGVGQSRPSLSRFEFICGSCNRKEELEALQKRSKESR